MSLLAYVHAKSLQSCSTLCNPREYSPPASSVCGILQGRILECIATPSSRRFSLPRDQTCVFCGSCIAGRFFTTEPLRKSMSLLSEPSNLGSGPEDHQNTTKESLNWHKATPCCKGQFPVKRLWTIWNWYLPVWSMSNSNRGHRWKVILSSNMNTWATQIHMSFFSLVVHVWKTSPEFWLVLFPGAPTKDSLVDEVQPLLRERKSRA